jgi:hypothetical protein
LGRIYRVRMLDRLYARGYASVKEILLSLGLQVHAAQQVCEAQVGAAKPLGGTGVACATRVGSSGGKFVVFERSRSVRCASQKSKKKQ